MKTRCTPTARETDLTGQEANQLYSPIEFLTAIGAKIVFAGDVSTSTSGVDPYWHQVAIVEYPCPISLFAMSADPEFQARAVHKDAGLEATIVMVTHLQPLEELGEVQTPFPGTAEDPSFELVRVHRYRQQALYPEGSNEPDRSGQEAMDLYGSNVQDVALQYGVYPKAHLKVQGVFIGDEREWDDVWIHAVPSNAAFEALSADPAVVAAQHHLEAALEDTYGLVTHPFSHRSQSWVTPNPNGRSCKDSCFGAQPLDRNASPNIPRPTPITDPIQIPLPRLPLAEPTAAPTPTPKTAPAANRVVVLHSFHLSDMAPPWLTNV